LCFPRFLGQDGKVYHGEPQGALSWPHLTARSAGTGHLPSKSDAGKELTAKVIVNAKGTSATSSALDIFSPESWTVTDQVIPVARLLSPLSHVPTFRCIGLNYAKHAEETKMPIPKFPILFMKPSMALQDPFAEVVIPSIAENSQADFENELAVVIGKRCKNVKEEDALNHVLGKELFLFDFVFSLQWSVSRHKAHTLLTLHTLAPFSNRLHGRERY
jgi:hypothetical protein